MQVSGTAQFVLGRARRDLTDPRIAVKGVCEMRF